MGRSLVWLAGRVSGAPFVPPSQPTQTPLRLFITGPSAVTRPPGASSQPSSPFLIGSRFATATTGLPEALRLGGMTTAKAAADGPISCFDATHSKFPHQQA